MPNAKVLSEKQAIVAALAERLKGASAGVFVDYKGITVDEDTKLRTELRQNDVEYSVVKNTLTRFALKDVGLEAMSDLLNGTTSLATSTADPIVPIRMIHDMSEKMAKDDAEKYNSFWKLHGKVFKLGYSDFVNRDRITPLLRFNSSAMEDADDLTSLDDYISRARESQKEIWYVAAPSREAAKVNPHSEVFRRKGLEVLYLYEPVDEFALETLAKYKDYTFKAVEHADSAVLDAFADTDEQPKAAPLSNEDMNEFDKLLETIRKVLGDQIKDARVSHRLADSPACLVSPDDGVTSSMERLMRVMQKDDSIPQKIFEINRDHPLLRTMLKLSKADPDDPQLAEMIQSLFDSTLLLDGYIKDPHALASRATKLLEQASAWYADVKKL